MKGTAKRWAATALGALVGAAVLAWLFLPALGRKAGEHAPRDLQKQPRWLQTTVIYGVVPAFYGGISGITAKLDDIAALGVNAIWVAPIMDAPERDSGYDVLDHYSISPSLGTDDDLRRLVAEAHARGIRVILDIALNHLSATSFMYRDVIEHGRDSKYYDFFERHDDGAEKYYFNWTGLKNLNYKNPAVRQYACGALEHWLRFDIDGFRLDAAWAIQERAPDFWRQCFSKLRRIKPDVLLLAEASARDPAYGENGFDVAYDWTEHLGQWAWGTAFGSDEPATRLRAALSAKFGKALVMHFLDNNDTGERFITVYGPGATRASAALLLTVPGVPALYMGEEVGAQYLPYGGPHPLSGDDPHALKPWFKQLVGLRNRQAALRSADIEFVETSNPGFVLAYVRPSVKGSRGQHSGDAILMLINFSSAPVDLSLSDADALASKLGGNQVKDLLDGSDVSLRSPASMRLEAHEVKVLQRR